MRYITTSLSIAALTLTLLCVSYSYVCADDPFGPDDSAREQEADPFAGSDASPFVADDDLFGGFGGDETEEDPFAGGEEEDNDDLFGDGEEERPRNRRGRRGRDANPFGASAAETNGEDIDVMAKSLARKTSLDFDETALYEAIEIIKEQNEGINIHLDKVALEETGIDKDSPISLHLRDISLRTCLQLMLEPLDLTYQASETENLLVITSIDKAEATLSAKVYPLHDMLNKKDPNASAASLIKTITTITVPSSWEKAGGPASISFYQGNLVVSQSPSGHQAVVDLLDKLRSEITASGGPVYTESDDGYGGDYGAGDDFGGGGYGGGTGADDGGGYGAEGYGGGGGYGAEGGGAGRRKRTR